ncbi:hypothetical protein GXC69_10830 [Candidatus Macondimonas diazotrophica]|jgi:hypothetical protein|nr:hypothetical protein [Candidatus Macondimonas diazotrophica]
MSDTDYVVLRPMLTDAGGRANVEYQPGDPILIEDSARATYLLDAGFIARPGGEACERGLAATSDAPERADLEVSDTAEDAAEQDAAPARPRRTRKPS